MSQQLGIQSLTCSARRRLSLLYLQRQQWQRMQRRQSRRDYRDDIEIISDDTPSVTPKELVAQALGLHRSVLTQCPPASQTDTPCPSGPDTPPSAEDDFKQSISEAVSMFIFRCKATENDLREELEGARARQGELCRRISQLEGKHEGLVARNREVDKELKDIIARLQRCYLEFGRELDELRGSMGYPTDFSPDSPTSKRTRQRAGGKVSKNISSSQVNTLTLNGGDDD